MGEEWFVAPEESGGEVERGRSVGGMVSEGERMREEGREWDDGGKLGYHLWHCSNEMNFYLHMFRGGMVSEWCLYFEIESEQKTAFSVGVKQYCTFPGRLGSGLKFIRSAQMEREIGGCFSPIQKYAEGGRALITLRQLREGIPVFDRT
jgi:hypothetical protein